MQSYWIGLAITFLLLILIIGYIRLYNRLHRLRVKVEESGADISVALERRFDLLNEEIEAVKKYLSHEYKLFTDITALRAGADAQEKNRLQREALSQQVLKTINDQISRQAENMGQLKRQLDQNARTKNFLKTRQNQQAETAGRESLSYGMQQHDAMVSQKINYLADAHHSLADIGANVNALAEQYPSLSSWISMDHFQRSIFNSEEHLQAARRLYNANASLYNQTLESIPWSFVAALCHMQRAPYYEVEAQKRNCSVHFD